MILKMFSIYDRKAEVHQPPLYCHNIGHAMRVFQDVFRTPDSVLSRYPEDFQVFEVGTFDDQSALIVGLDKPHLVCPGTELVPQRKESADDAENHTA